MIDDLFESENIDKDEKGYFTPICTLNIPLYVGISYFCELNCPYFKKIYMEEYKKEKCQ